MLSCFRYIKSHLASPPTQTALTMKALFSSLTTSLLFSLALLPAMPVAAASPALIIMAAQAPAVSESAAVANALRAVKGRVLSVQLIESRGPPVYRVKILTEDGRVRTVHVDGQTGEVISY
ncbi:hypothetical protein HPT27_14280 [Permianibacter sp. IMCC34836]|uniref:PepSY domain-containing protein n=1 Tax=Permianibacter fluminis TaxID=2738515 RepID=UPI001553019E|nr:PepSY domain-containing protein [Permianibacter fluminis]NQD38193.1 hypothetical protein [Permianibacter fluminis]